MKKIEVTICMGTTCFVMGASELESVMDRIDDKFKDLIDFKGASCLGYCKDRKYGNAPYAVVDGQVCSSVSAEKLYSMIMECISKLSDAEE